MHMASSINSLGKLGEGYNYLITCNGTHKVPRVITLVQHRSSSHIMHRSQRGFFVSVRQWVVKREISSSRREILQQVKIISHHQNFSVLIIIYLALIVKPNATRYSTLHD